VDNNYLDLDMNKSGFFHTLPSGRLKHWFVVLDSLWVWLTVHAVLHSAGPSSAD
jgi:hypothetical protein